MTKRRRWQEMKRFTAAMAVVCLVSIIIDSAGYRTTSHVVQFLGCLYLALASL